MKKIDRERAALQGRISALRSLLPDGPYHIDDWGNLCAPDDTDGDPYVLVRNGRAVAPSKYSTLGGKDQERLFAYFVALANLDRLDTDTLKAGDSRDE